MRTNLRGSNELSVCVAWGCVTNGLANCTGSLCHLMDTQNVAYCLWPLFSMHGFHIDSTLRVYCSADICSYVSPGTLIMHGVFC